MDNTFYVNIGVNEAANIAIDKIIRGSISGTLLDDYSVGSPDGGFCRVVIFEKYYARVSNRMTLTAVFDNMSGRTRVHFVGGGGGQNVLFSFDWGAASSFENSVYNALRRFIV